VRPKLKEARTKGKKTKKTGEKEEFHAKKKVKFYTNLWSALELRNKTFMQWSYRG
jgi:hypothetical protein